MDNESEVATNYSLQEKWGTALNDGFVVLPSALIRYQRKLKLSDGELVVLLNLVMSWWKVAEFPYPQTTTLAKRMGVTTRTVQRHVERLEEKGYIKRIWKEKRRDARVLTQYDLTGIVDELKELGNVERRVKESASALNAVSAGGIN